MGKKILVSLEIPGLRPWDRYSAVACVVSSFSGILSQKGYEVYINQYPYQTVSRKISENGKHPAKQRLFPYDLHKFFPKRWREFIKDLGLWYALRGQLKEVMQVPRPDFVLSWVSYGSSNGVKLATHWNIPLIAIYDNRIVEEYSFQHSFRPFFLNYVERQEKEMLFHARKVVVYSLAMAEVLTAHYGRPFEFRYMQFIDKQKMNFIEPKESGETIGLIYIGSFFAWHKVGLLVRSFIDILQQRQDVILYLVGSGPELGAIQDLVDQDGIRNRVIFKGNLDKEGLRGLLEQCSIGVIPSALWFHAPLKLFQYAAAGLCIVAADTPTIRWIDNDGKAALHLFGSGQESLTKALLQLLSDNKARLSNQQCTQEWVKHRYSDKVYEDFFDELFLQE